MDIQQDAASSANDAAQQVARRPVKQDRGGRHPGEAQKSMRLFAMRLALTTEVFCEKIIPQGRDVESVASQAREQCIRQSK
jgi:hypothetical protein